MRDEQVQAHYRDEQEQLGRCIEVRRGPREDEGNEQEQEASQHLNRPSGIEKPRILPARAPYDRERDTPVGEHDEPDEQGVHEMPIN